MLPDLITRIHRDRSRPRALTDEEKDRDESRAPAALRHAGRADSQHLAVAQAYCLYEKDVQYVVEENKVIIVDEYTGRKMPGRRWSDGLHQAVEAKEGVADRARDADPRHDHDSELFPPLPKAGGHDRHRGNRGRTNSTTSTNSTSSSSRRTGRSRARTTNDRIYKTRREKYNAVIKEIREAPRARASRSSSARSASKPANCSAAC